MVSHDLDDVTSLRWRSAARANLAEVHALLSAIAAFDDTPQRWGPHDLPQWFDATGPLASELMAIGFERDSMVAVGWLTIDDPLTIRIDGAVHPAFRHQGIGWALTRWQLHRARDCYLSNDPTQPLRLLAFSAAILSNKRALLTQQGFTPTRWLIDMICEFPLSRIVAEYVVTPVLGIRFEKFGPEWIEPTRAAHNEAFADRWGADAVDADTWAGSLTGDHARPDLSWVAVDEWGSVVGYALNSSTEDLGGPAVGWTDRLGVRPAQRGRNIARVLLARSLDSFRQAGMDAGGVGIDSVDGGGTTLYESLGYLATDTIIQFERRETPAEARAALTP